MAVVERKIKSGVVFWVVFKWHGKDVWERSGRDRRAAARLDAQRKREVKTGTYEPAGQRKATTFGQYIGAWLPTRKGRNADDEQVAVRRYVLSCDWLTVKPLEDVRNADALRLWEELLNSISETTGEKLSTKYAANIYGVVRTGMRLALLKELTQRDAFALPRGTIRRKKGSKKRVPYDVQMVLSLTHDERVSLESRMWNALAFYLGGREGEICGRRWRNWDRSATPLTSMVIDTQYDDQPLKTESDEGGEHPRIVPVHPHLEKALTWWWSAGFEMVFRRKPTEDDFIVPRLCRSTKQLLNHTKSSAYKAWRRACVAAEVPNRTLHATRHTLVTNARRNGARDEVLEVVTHNAAGKQIDAYTHWEWDPLCEAVGHFMKNAPIAQLDSGLDRHANSSRKVVEAPGIEQGGHLGTIERNEESSGEEPPSGSGNSASTNRPDALLGAAQALGAQGVRVEVDGRVVARVDVRPGDDISAIAQRLGVAVEGGPLKARSRGTVVELRRAGGAS